MNKRVLTISIIVVLIIVGFLLIVQNFFTITPSTASEDLSYLSVPPGYAIEVWADGLSGSSVSIPGPNKGARMLEEKDGVFYVSVPAAGKIVRLYDRDNDWVIEDRNVLIDGLSRPHGIAFYDDYVYVAEDSRVIRFKEDSPENIQVLVEYPSNGHWTRTIRIIDDELYISAGSSCNACDEDNVWRAAITRCDLSGNDCHPFATGLRNAVGFIEHNGAIYATENGRDLLGNDVPPEEINIIKEGNNYGWPYCYGDRIHDTVFDENTYIRDPCLDTEPPFVTLQAHSAPLGLDIYNNKLLVAYHGSWNRNPPTGYKVVSIDLFNRQVEDFVSGWLGSNGGVYGRPVDVLVFDDNILISDDLNGVIYRVYRT